MVRAVGNYYYDVSNNNFTISVALPLELTHFEAKTISKTAVKLDWTTASELGLRGFGVEKSTGSAFDFEPIGYVQSTGDGTLQRNYSFKDEKIEPGRTYYYRLFFDENNGGEQPVRSPIRAVSTGIGDQLLAVEPNPVFESAVLKIGGEASFEGPIELEIYAMTGVLVKKIRLDGDLQFDLSDLQSGSFVAVARSERQIWTGRFFKI